MPCRESEAIDLAEYAADPRDDRWSAFRAHYPTCPDCSAAVSRLTMMEIDVERAVASDPRAPDGHPGPPELLGFMERSLEPARRVALEEHLDRCADCRAELAAVRIAEGRLAALDLTSAATASEAEEASWLAPLGDWLFGRRGLASAALIVILFSVALWATVFDRTDLSEEGPRIVQSPSPEIPSGSGPGRLAEDPSGSSAPPEPSSVLAARPEPTPSATSEQDGPAPPPPPAGATPTPLLAEQGTPDPLDVPIPPVEPPSPDMPPRDRGHASDEGEVVLLAALDASRIPPGALAYERDRLSVDARIERLLGVQRNAVVEDDLTVVALAPSDEAGRTLSPRPTLYWALAQRSPFDIRVSLTELDGIEPLLSRVFDGPVERGLHALSLADLDRSLRPDTAYVYEVALVVDPRRRDRDVVSTRVIRYVRRPEVEQALEVTPREEAVHLLAREALWIDAFDRANALVEGLPDSDRARALRAELLRAADIAEAMEWLEGPE